MKSPRFLQGSSWWQRFPASLPQRFLFNLVAPEAQVYSATTHSGIGLCNSRSLGTSTLSWMRQRIGPALLILSIAGCAQTPTVLTQTVTVPQYVKIPENLLEVPPLVYPPQATFGQVEGILYDGLQTCRGDLQAISQLGKGQPKPP